MAWYWWLLASLGLLWFVFINLTVLGLVHAHSVLATGLRSAAQALFQVAKNTDERFVADETSIDKIAKFLRLAFGLDAPQTEEPPKQTPPTTGLKN